MKRVFFKISVCTLVLIHVACAGKSHLPDYVDSPEITIIEEIPSPRPPWTYTTITEDDEYFYFVGLTDKSYTVEMAVSSAFANGMKQILQYLGSKVNYRWEKTRIEEELNYLNLPPDPTRINSVVENIDITGNAIIRKAKSTRTYYKKYFQDHRERVDAYVEVRYPKEEARRLEYLNGLLGKTVLIPEEVDTLLPQIKILDMTSTPPRDRMIFGNLLWLLNPSPDLTFSYFDDERTLAFLSSLDLNFLRQSLEAFDKEDILSLEGWQTTDPQKGRLNLRMEKASNEVLEPIERLITIDPDSPIERIRILADIPRSPAEGSFLNETVKNKRNVIIQKAAEEDPLLYLDASQNMVMTAPDWSLDFLNMAELTPEAHERYHLQNENIISALNMLFDTTGQFYSTRILSKKPIERDPEDYRVLTRIISKSLDLCITSGLYKSRTFNVLESFLKDLSETVHKDWSSRWELDRLESWIQNYRNFQWTEIIADFNNGGLPVIDEYSQEASLILMKTYFWSLSDSEMRLIIGSVLDWMDEHQNLRVTANVKPEFMTFASIFLFENAIENRDSTQLEIAMEWCSGECEDHPLGSSTRLLAQSVFGLSEPVVANVIEETRDLFYSSNLYRPERVWVFWTLYRYLDNVRANNALKLQFIKWLLDRLNHGEIMRGLDRTSLLTLRDSLNVEGPIIELTHEGDGPWIFRTTPWFSIEANAFFPHQVDSLFLFNSSESKSFPIQNQITGHTYFNQIIPLTNEWNPITLRANGDILSFLLVFYKVVEE